MIKWCEHYGILPPHLINELKAKPLTFRNWNNLNEADKLLLKNIPDEWIPSVYQFQDFCFIRKFCPVEIPNIAMDIPKLKSKGYIQVEFKFTDSNGFNINARVHQPIPNSTYFDDGQVWIIHRHLEGSPNGSIQSVKEIMLENGTWFNAKVDKSNKYSSLNWEGLKSRQGKIPPIITTSEEQILAMGHFKAK
jgi:hypothetical protein